MVSGRRGEEGERELTSRLGGGVGTHGCERERCEFGDWAPWFRV